MSNCGCEGSCPICRVGEIEGHECNNCGVAFCSKCHGLESNIEIVRRHILFCNDLPILPCRCKQKTAGDNCQA